MATSISTHRVTTYAAARLGWRWLAALLGAALVLAYGFTVLLARYWAFYHLDTPGTGMGLVVFVLPTALALGLAVSVSVARRLVHRGRPRSGAVARGLTAAALTLVTLFGIEVWATAGARSAEGALAEDLGPFAASLVGRR
jgi:hypothetical protein